MYPLEKIVSTNYTGWNRTRTQRAVCSACAAVMQGRPPFTMRLMSVIYREDGGLPLVDLTGGSRTMVEPEPGIYDLEYRGRRWGIRYRPGRVQLTSKADLRAALDLCLHPPDCRWFVSIADSGQKHHLPWAVCNDGPGPWAVQVDGLRVIGTPADMREIVGHVQALLRAGWPKGAIATQPSATLLARTLDIARQHWGPLQRWRGSPLMTLALMLVKRKKED